MYYVIRIQRKKDGTEVRNITPFNTIDDAEIQYHKCLAADMGNEELDSVICFIFKDEVCNIVLSRYWNAPQE